MTFSRFALALALSALMLFSSAVLRPAERSEGAVVDTFEDGSDEKVLTFTGPGTNKDTELSLEVNVTFSSATMDIEGSEDSAGRNPWNVTVDLGDDSKLEWRFKGDAVGAWGEQTIFNTTRRQEFVIFQGAEGANPASIRLPKGATVKSATMDLTGDTLDIHFLSLSSSLTSQESDDISRLQGMGFAVASTPMSNSVVPQGAAVAFTEDLSSFATGLHGIMTQGVPVLIFGKGVQALDNMGLTTTASWRSWSGGCNSFKVQANYAGIMNGLNLGQTYTPFTYIGSNTLYGVVEPPSNQWCGVNLASFIGGIDWDPEVHIGVADPAVHTYLSQYTGNIDSKVFFSGFYCFPNTIMTPTWNTLVSNAVNWMIGGASTGGPEGVSLNLGPSGGIPVWSYAGELMTTQKTQDFATELNTYLSTAQTSYTSDYGTEFVDVPLNLTAETGGRVRLDNLTVEYDYSTTLDLTEALNKYIEKQPVPAGWANHTVTIAVSTDSHGVVTLSDLNITYDGPPHFRSTLPLSVEMYEDTADPALLDLARYAWDDYEDPDNLTYEVTKNSHPDNVALAINDGHFLGVDPTLVPNWNSEVSTEGLVEVRLKVTDSNNLSAFSPIIVINVLPVNDEPVASEEIPDYVILEGESDSSINLQSRPYFHDVEYDTLTFAAAVDPLGTVPGAGLNLTAQINPITKVLTIEALDDYFTPEDVYIPVHIYCDDDPEVNTESDGYLDEALTLPNWTYQEVLVTVLNVNDAPEWGSIPDLVTDEDVAVEDAFLLSDYVTDIDSDPSEWKFEIKANSNRKLLVTLDEKTSAVSLLPVENANGNAKVDVQVSDGDDKSKASFRVVVNPVNDPPQLAVTSHAQGGVVTGNVTLAGTAADVEMTLVKVEFAVGEGGTWLPVSGTTLWSHIWNTQLLPNGPVSVRFRAFDGEAYSENLTLDLTIDNPVNLRPVAAVTSPAEGDRVAAGVMTVTGTSLDTDGTVRLVKVQVGDSGGWVRASPNLEGAWDTWSYTFNNSQWEGKNLTVRARALDESSASEDANATFFVVPNEKAPEKKKEIEDNEGVEQDLTWLWLLIAAVIVALVLLLLFMRKRKKDREKAEEEERRRKEEEEASARAASLSSQLKLATPATVEYEPPGTYGGYSPGFGAPLPPPPAPTPAQLPQPPSASPGYASSYLSAPYGSDDDPLLLTAGRPEAGGYSPQPPPPPMAAAPAASPGAPPGGDFGSVPCYNCGGQVPITSAARPLSVTCPACGTVGEIN